MEMNLLHSGALLALIASCCWTFAPFFFASAVRSIGAYYTNFWRLIMASGFLWIIALIVIAIHPEVTRGITTTAIFWMALSGIMGLFIGDLFYFKALGALGPRRTLQILTSVPIFSALGALLFLGERLSVFANVGITIVVSAIFMVNVFDKQEKATTEPGKFSYRGIWFAVLGAACQGGGAVLMRNAYMASDNMNTILATAIRISSAGVAFVIVALITGKISGAVKAVPNAKAFGRLIGGTSFGPVLGMLFYIASLKYAPAGIASTMSSLSPILIIPITALRYKTRLNWPALVAMLITVGGVLLIFR